MYTKLKESNVTHSKNILGTLQLPLTLECLITMGFEPTPVKTSALNWRLRPLGHVIDTLSTVILRDIEECELVQLLRRWILLKGHKKVESLQNKDAKKENDRRGIRTPAGDPSRFLVYRLNRSAILSVIHAD